VISARRLAEDQLSRGEKNCIVYSLFCILIIIIIIIISSIISSIYFAVLLKSCLYLSP